MKKIRVDFVDFWFGFDKYHNSIYDFLKKKYDVEISEQPDYLFYSCFGYKFLEYDCIKIFFTGENVRPDFNLCDYAIGFDYINFGDRYIRWPLYMTLQYRTDYVRALNKHKDYINKDPDSYKFCNFIYSNNLAISNRDELFEQLCKYKRVDSGGKHKNNIGGRVKDKFIFQQQYKFSIAYENSSTPGYLTEKIIQALAAGTVPIYWGDPEILKEINSNCFINAHDFASMDDLVAKIIEIDNNNELYMQMIKTPSFTDEHLKAYKDDILEAWFDNIFLKEVDKASRRTGYMWEKRVENRYCLVKRILNNKLFRKMLKINLIDY